MPQAQPSGASAAIAIACLLGLLAIGVPSAEATQTVPNGLKRVFALENSRLGIDGHDDTRVDVDVAVLDTGISLEHPDLNIVERTNCLNASPPEYTCEKDSPDDGDDGHGHGTGVAEIIGAVDNGIGGGTGSSWVTGHAADVGVAPGARLWAVDITDESLFEELLEAGALYEEEQPWANPAMDADAAIAGLKWVTERADEIEVAAMLWYCSTAAEPAIPQPVCSAQDAEAVDSAVEDAVDAGVVVVVPAGNWFENVEPYSVPARVPEAITVSAIADTDGLAGGLGAPGGPCPVANAPAEELDDTNADTSHHGARVDVAAPGPCTSGATPHVAGAAAILASASGPEDAEDVAAIRDAIVEAGNANPSSHPTDPGWDDESGDGVKEPLLDVGDEGAFDPATICAEGAWAEPDVNGDCHADLVSLSPDGVGRTYLGQPDGRFGEGVESFLDGEGGGTLDPAQFDGEGHHVVDVADVTGDGRADLVTVSDDGDAHTYAGQGGGAFGSGVVTDLGLTPALLEPGGDEPIAAADVDGDGRADLIVYDDESDELTVYPGKADGSFASGVLADGEAFSALHTGTGEYFVDAADLTGDGRADLVSMTPWDTPWLRVGKADGSFADPVSSHTGALEPAMDDGIGHEPVGLGDVDGDGRADLVTLEDGTAHVYPGLKAGGFGNPVSSFGGGMPSSAFEGSGFEAAALLDVDHDHHADLMATYADGNAYVFLGAANGTFAAYATSLESTLESTQHRKNQDASGHQLVSEKPAWRRHGCSRVGCNPTGDRVGVWREGEDGWVLREWDLTLDPFFEYLEYGSAAAPEEDLPVVGDWDGDGVDTIGVWRREGEFAEFLLRDSNTEGPPDRSLVWGIDEAPQNDLPVVGDWDGDGVDTIGVWRREGELATFILRDSLDPEGAPFDEIVTFGIDEAPEEDLPVVGDWDGDGVDTVGVWRRSDDTWYLRDSNDPEQSGFTSFQFGSAGSPQNDLPVAGDWDGDGVDTVGVYRREGEYGEFLLRNSNSAGPADYELGWGVHAAPANDLPIVGRWGGG